MSGTGSSLRSSFSSTRNWEIFDTPSPPRKSCLCSSSSASLAGASRLSISTPLSERHGGKFFSFSACSTPASNFIFRCLGSGEVEGPRRILIVVDASKEMTIEALEWTLAHIAQTGDFVIFLGLLPWLTLPLAVKRWTKLQSIENYRSSMRFETSEFSNIQKLYETKGVYLAVQILSGFPRRELAVEMAKKLDAGWIIFYRWMAQSSNYFQSKLGQTRHIVYLTSKSEGIVCFASKPTIREAPGFSNSPPPKINLTSNYMKLAHILKRF